MGMGKGRGHGHGHRGRGGRLFDYGELRLLLLAMIAERPSHGYELIKLIEERMAGSYSPSPGVIYPTLAWLEDMGYAAIEPGEGGRKICRITPEGEAFVTANRAAVDDVLNRTGPQGRPRHAPQAVAEAMDALKTALRARLGQDTADADSLSAIADILRDAARRIGES